MFNPDYSEIIEERHREASDPTTSSKRPSRSSIRQNVVRRSIEDLKDEAELRRLEDGDYIQIG